MISVYICISIKHQQESKQFQFQSCKLWMTQRISDISAAFSVDLCKYILLNIHLKIKKSTQTKTFIEPMKFSEIADTRAAESSKEVR